MAALTQQQLMALIPGEVYNKLPTSNMYIMVRVLQQVFSDLHTILNQLIALKNIATISDIHLDRWAADYGLQRDGLTDTEFRIKLATKISSGEYGVTIPGIIKTLSRFVNPLSNLMLTERSNDSLGVIWDGTYFWNGHFNWSGAGAIRWRTFDVSLDFHTGISDPTIGAAVNKMKDNLKGAGITMTVEYF